LIGLSHLELDLAKVERSLAAARSGLRVHDETGSRLGVLNALEAVAAAETAAQRLQPGVRLYGAAAALRERLGTPALPPESVRHEERCELARAALGEQRFASEWGRGRALSWEEATALALGAAPAEPGRPCRLPPACGRAQSAVDEAEAGGDDERKARARQELEFIEHELAAAYGLGGTARRLADPAERARKAVANRIRDAVSRIEAHHPALGRHLRTSIRTGTFCCYEPERTVTWDVHSAR
jgi:hypothetical protein